jgi:hypothetical protein
MATRVHAATIHDSVGAVDTIKLLRYDFPRLRKIIADIVKCLGWELSVVLRSGESSKIMTESKLICFEFTGYQLIQEEGADFARQLIMNYLFPPSPFGVLGTYLYRPRHKETTMGRKAAVTFLLINL